MICIVRTVLTFTVTICMKIIVHVEIPWHFVSLNVRSNGIQMKDQRKTDQIQ